MEEMLISTDQFLFSTSTAEVFQPNDFVVELIPDMQGLNTEPEAVIKIKNIDELIDFLENTDW